MEGNSRLSFLGLATFCKAIMSTPEERSIQTFLPPTPKCIIFLPTPILLVDFRWNFLLICFITAVLIDLITMTATAWIKPERWEQGLGKEGDEGIPTRYDSLCWYSSLLFTWYPVSAKQCTALVLSLITNQIKVVFTRGMMVYLKRKHFITKTRPWEAVTQTFRDLWKLWSALLAGRLNFGVLQIILLVNMHSLTQGKLFHSWKTATNMSTLSSSFQSGQLVYPFVLTCHISS